MMGAVYHQSSSIKIQDELNVLIWQLLDDEISKAQVHALAGQPPFPGAPPRPAPPPPPCHLPSLSAPTRARSCPLSCSELPGALLANAR